MATRTFTTAGGPVDLARTLFPLRRGTGDPTTRIGGAEAWRTLRTPEGAATLHLHAFGGCIDAEAWGPGTTWALEHAPALVGADDTGEGFVPHDDLIADLWHRHRDVRLTRTGAVVPTLVAAILEQKVTGVEARGAWRGLGEGDVGARAGPAAGSPAPAGPRPRRGAAVVRVPSVRRGVAPRRRRARPVRPGPALGGARRSDAVAGA